MEQKRVSEVGYVSRVLRYTFSASYLAGASYLLILDVEEFHGPRGLLLARFSPAFPWHTATLAIVLATGSYILMRTGKLRAAAAPFFLGAAGDLWFNVYFIHYYGLTGEMVQDARYYLGLLLVAALGALALRGAVRFRRFTLLLIGGVTPYMAAWILLGGFHVSVCACSYGTRYMYNVDVNLWELGYWLITAAALCFSHS